MKHFDTKQDPGALMNSLFERSDLEDLFEAVRENDLKSEIEFNSLVSIDYSEEFREIHKFFRVLFEKQEISERSFEVFIFFFEF